MPRSEKETELEAILTEVNNGIKKNKKADKTSFDDKKTSQKEESKSSFIENAKIIEEEPLKGEPQIDKAEKHISVKEVVSSEPEPTKQAKPKEHEKPKKEKAEYPSRAELKRANGTAVSRSPSSREKPTSRPQHGVVILGIFITLFVLIGLASTVWTGIKFTGDLINETALKEELSQVIFPLVIVDIPEFETPTMLDSAAIVSSSIWGFVIDEQDKTKYKKDDFGSIYVPDVDIEKYVRSLYGAEVKIAHQSIDDSNVQMLYNSESKYYVIESTPRFLPYTPRVDKIVKTGNILTLKVSYILPDAMWNMKSAKKTEVVDKIMEYTLKKNDGKYQILSVKLLEVTNNSQNANEAGNAAPVMNEAEEIEPEAE